MNFSYYPPSVDLTFKMISPEEETQLFEKARAGDTAAREFLIRNHLLFAALHARRLSKGQLPEEEVTSAANEALMNAFERFDFRRGNRFTSYLRPILHRAVSKMWKDHYNTDIPTENIEEVGADNPHETEDSEEHQTWVRDQLWEAASNVLTQQEFETLQSIYLSGKSCAQIARERVPEVSRKGVHATHVRALRKLRKALLKLGLKGSL